MNDQSIGVAGLGFLGSGIAACLLAHGMSVVGCDFSPAARDSARRTIAGALQELLHAGRIDSNLAAGWKQRYTETPDPAGLAGCAFVIESITEDLAAKTALFAALEAVLPPQVPIGSNTSSIPITVLQTGRLHPDRFVGMHWASPAYATRFLEIIRGDATSDRTMDATQALATALGKEPCIVQKDVPGFIVNRLAYAVYREACHLMATGVADAETIDRAFRNSVGLWAPVCGPLRWIDLTGGPELYAKAMERIVPTLSNADAPPEPIRTLAAEGRTGITSGTGFYDYTADESVWWQRVYGENVWRMFELQTRLFAESAETKPASASS